MNYNEKTRWEGECGFEGCHGDVFVSLWDNATKDHQYLCKDCTRNSHRILRYSTDVDLIETGERIPLPELRERLEIE